ncbi:MAG: helix-turn-helix transcriptional regulator [Elusimicrobiota bacterium]
MTPLRVLRERRGLSQRELAKRAGVAFRTVQLLEWGKHDARLSTIARINRALGQEASDEESPRPAEDSVAQLATGPADEAEGGWKSALFEFVEAFRREPGPRLIPEPPSRKLPAKLQALWACVVESLCHEQGVEIPLWCGGIGTLREPWFVSGVENLKASALVESPAWFRKRNIFVLGNFLDRA